MNDSSLRVALLALLVAFSMYAWLQLGEIQVRMYLQNFVLIR